jgi:hypothetical protein
MPPLTASCSMLTLPALCYGFLLYGRCCRLLLHATVSCFVLSLPALWAMLPLPGLVDVCRQCCLLPCCQLKRRSVSCNKSTAANRKYWIFVSRPMTALTGLRGWTFLSLRDITFLIYRLASCTVSMPRVNLSKLSHINAKSSSL